MQVGMGAHVWVQSGGCAAVDMQRAAVHFRRACRTTRLHVVRARQQRLWTVASQRGRKPKLDKAASCDSSQRAPRGTPAAPRPPPCRPSWQCGCPRLRLGQQKNKTSSCKAVLSSQCKADLIKVQAIMAVWMPSPAAYDVECTAHALSPSD